VSPVDRGRLLRTRLAAPVVWLAVLTGCVPGTAVYDKPGVTYAESYQQIKTHEVQYKAVKHVI